VIHVGNRLVSSAARTLPPEQRKMSMIFQSYALWPHMTVAENITYGLRLRKLDRDTIAKKLRAILETTKLEVLAQRYPGELSGGQQQRVALARALVVEPETLLLDEPLSNLDANLREEMRFEIRRLHDEYRYTTVYVTHDQSEAMTTADLIAVMNAGKIDQLGTPEDIYERPQSEFVARFIGSSNVIKGIARDENHVAFSGATLQVMGAKLQAGQNAVVAIRQHDIQLSTSAPPTPGNAVKATVTRQVFLGANRDSWSKHPTARCCASLHRRKPPFPRARKSGSLCRSNAAGRSAGNLGANRSAPCDNRSFPDARSCEARARLRSAPYSHLPSAPKRRRLKRSRRN